eukprot:jgi/Tetstr1/426790/TSEL_017005.t1
MLGRCGHGGESDAALSPDSPLGHLTILPLGGGQVLRLPPTTMAVQWHAAGRAVKRSAAGLGAESSEAAAAAAARGRCGDKRPPNPGASGRAEVVAGAA